MSFTMRLLQCICNHVVYSLTLRLSLANIRISAGITISSNRLILTSCPWRQCGTYRHDGIHDLLHADVNSWG